VVDDKRNWYFDLIILYKLRKFEGLSINLVLIGIKNLSSDSGKVGVSVIADVEQKLNFVGFFKA
jgi:hypothetical protein